MKRSFVDVPEGQVHYRTEGSGEPILLLHQQPTSSKEYERVIPILAHRYRVIAMDILGYGDSDKPPRQYQVQDYARSVVSFLDALGIDRTNVAGHHVGTYIAVELATEYPDRISKLVLGGCTCRKQPEEGQILINQARDFKLEADGSHLMRAWETVVQNLGEALDTLPLEVVETFVIDYLKAGTRVEEGHRAVYVYDNYLKLPLIKCPTLLLYGDKDMSYPYLSLVKGLVPNNQVMVIKGGGDFILVQMPKEWAKSVLDFLGD